MCPTCVTSNLKQTKYESSNKQLKSIQSTSPCMATLSISTDTPSIMAELFINKGIFPNQPISSKNPCQCLFSNINVFDSIKKTLPFNYSKLLAFLPRPPASKLSRLTSLLAISPSSRMSVTFLCLLLLLLSQVEPSKAGPDPKQTSGKLTHYQSNQAEIKIGK